MRRSLRRPNRVKGGPIGLKKALDRGVQILAEGSLTQELWGALDLVEFYQNL
jgi:hypothetical protein